MSEQQTHKVAVYQEGRFLGCIGSGGYIKRLKIHQIPMTKAQAEEIAAEVTADADNPYTARAVPFGGWKG